MSTSRGNNARNRPQKHQNRTVFKNDLHDTSKRTKFINSIDVSGVCQRCKDIIQWKIKYKKYKPLSAPAKCVGCQQKAVKHAYHVMCTNCARHKNVCAKCCKAVEVNESEVNNEHQEKPSIDIEALLKTLPERKRRTLLRHMDKQNGEKNIPEDLLASLKDMAVTDDFDDFFSDGDLDEDDD